MLGTNPKTVRARDAWIHQEYGPLVDLSGQRERSGKYGPGRIIFGTESVSSVDVTGLSLRLYRASGFLRTLPVWGPYLFLFLSLSYIHESGRMDLDHHDYEHCDRTQDHGIEGVSEIDLLIPLDEDSEAQERRLLRKLDKRILPILCLLYLFACEFDLLDFGREPIKWSDPWTRQTSIGRTWAMLDYRVCPEMFSVEIPLVYYLTGSILPSFLPMWVSNSFGFSVACQLLSDNATRRYFCKFRSRSFRSITIHAFGLAALLSSGEYLLHQWSENRIIHVPFVLMTCDILRQPRILLLAW